MRSLRSRARSRVRRRRDSSSGLGGCTMVQTWRSPRIQAIRVRRSFTPSILSVFGRRCRRLTAIEAGSTTWLMIPLRTSRRWIQKPSRPASWMTMIATGAPVRCAAAACRRQSSLRSAWPSPPGRPWRESGQRLWVASISPGLSAKLSFYGLYLYNEGQVRLWPFARANGEHTVELLRRLRAEWPDRKLLVLWDGAPYHRAKAVREAARALDITLMPLPGYSPDLMPVEELRHWLREDVTYHHCHASAEDLTRRVADFEVRLNRKPLVIADRLWVKDCLDPEE